MNDSLYASETCKSNAKGKTPRQFREDFDAKPEEAQRLTKAEK